MPSDRRERRPCRRNACAFTTLVNQLRRLLDAYERLHDRFAGEQVNMISRIRHRLAKIADHAGQRATARTSARDTGTGMGPPWGFRRGS
jgi:hypothetical protein